MAEFALGLTKTAVEGTVSRVTSALEEEAKLKVRVQNDLVFITGEFQMMQSFLSVANKERAKNEVVRTWVRQVRDLAFDVEDCVELVVSLDAKKCSWFWRMLPGCIAPSQPLDDAVAKIEQLKARMEDVSQRNTRYNLITSGDGGDDASNRDSDQQLLMQGSASSAAAATFHVLRNIWQDMGKLQDTVSTSWDLTKLIGCQGSELQVISLWGSPQAHAVGVLGWKGIVKEAYNDLDVCREFKNRAWVKPTHPFSQVEFLNTLLSHFTSLLHHHHHNDIPELVRQVSKHRYLIVLEQELSSVADWDAIRLCLPDGNNGSRIVIFTRHFGIALSCTREPYQVLELKPFFRDQYLYAFFPKDCGQRMGMGELILQLRHPGVISLFCETRHDYDKLMEQLYVAEAGKMRVLDGVEVDKYSLFSIGIAEGDKKFELTDLAAELLRNSYPKNEQDDELEENVTRMSSQDKIERCRKLLSEHDYLVFIVHLRSTTDWDLIKRDLLPECIRGCIVVITDMQSMATHCADHKSRVLNAKDLIKGSDQQGERGHRDQGGSINEENFKFGELVGSNRYLDVRPAPISDFPIMVTWSVWGIAGVGKSAFTREKYYRSKINTRECRMYGWVDVSHPFNLTDFCRLLLLDFFSDDAEAKEAAAIGMMEGQDPTQWCCKILHDNNFFLVIDGLQSKHDWDLIEVTLLSEPINGTTVVITREESIAKHCATIEGFIINIKGLEDCEALEIFSKNRSSYQNLPPGPAEVLNLIISKCGGNPAIITAIADSIELRTRPKVENLEHVNAHFIGILEREPCLRGLFCWMQSYFDACPDELKPCIFYLSVFPAGQSIRRRTLLRRWIAEGYSTGGGSGSTAEEKGEKLLSELLKLSILYKEQRTSKIKSCKVNGFFREYIKSRPMEDNRMFELEGSCSPSSRLTGQHLTISSSWDRDVNVFNNIDLSRLRSLTVFGEWRSFLICDKMMFLRVLDLEGTSASDVTTSVTDNVLEQIVRLFPRLKFISLRGCVQVTCLPDSLGDMRQMQTLDIRYTSIVELPSTITKLHKLQYIRAGTSTDTSLLLLEKQTPPSPCTAAAAAAAPPPPHEDGNGDGSLLVRGIAAAPAAAASVVQLSSTRITEAWKRKVHDLVKSSHNNWWKLRNHQNLRRRSYVAANGGGVEVFHDATKGMGSLTDLHTLGVVNVARGKGAFLFLDEVKKLTQIRKLGLSGIHRCHCN